MSVWRTVAKELLIAGLNHCSIFFFLRPSGPHLGVIKSIPSKLCFLSCCLQCTANNLCLLTYWAKFMICSILSSYLLLRSGEKTMNEQSWVYDCFVPTVMSPALWKWLYCKFLVVIRALAAHRRLNESIFFFASNNYFCLILTNTIGMTKSQIRAGLDEAIPVWKSKAKRLSCNALYKHTQKVKTSWLIS